MRNSTLSQYIQPGDSRNMANLNDRSDYIAERHEAKTVKQQPRVSTAMARKEDRLQPNSLIRDMSPNFDRKYSAQMRFRPLAGGPPSVSN